MSAGAAQRRRLEVHPRPTSVSPTTWPATCTPRWRRGEVGAQRLLTLCERHGLDDIEALADEIIERSEAATRASHPRAAGGHVRQRAPCSTSPTAARSTSSARSRSTPMPATSSSTTPARHRPARTASTSSCNYTHAYTTFTVRSVLNPELPNNHGSLAPIRVEAPAGSIVHAVSPQPCTARHVVGHVPAQRAAQGAGPAPAAAGDGRGIGRRLDDAGQRQPRRRLPVHHGHVHLRRWASVHAQRSRDSSACSYPTGVAAVPVEVVEASAPIRFLRKELRQGSGGDGAAARRAGSDDRVHGRHDPAVAAERRHVAARATRRRGSSAASPARRDRSRSTASRCGHRLASRCSPVITCASICPVAVDTASR